MINKKINNIFTRCSAGKEKLTSEDIDMVVEGTAKARLLFAIEFALPPIVKKAIDKLQQYHEQVQILLQAA